jgi:hypothetical protein
MKNLKDFLNEYCSYLYDSYNFKLAELQPKDSNITILESSEIRIKIVSERGSIYFDFQGKDDEKKNDWYDLDVVRNYIKNPNHYELDGSYSKISNPYDLKLQDERVINESQYIKDNIKKIIDIFSKLNIDNSKKAMKKLRNQRAKILFG